MARRFHAAGHPLVLWNRDPAKAQIVSSETGGEVVSTAAEATEKARIVVSSLADDAALREVYLGPAGVAEGVSEGTVAVDTSTVDPLTVIEVGKAIDERGGGFLDCPVSGDVSVVDAGGLTVMAGGDEAHLEFVEPFLFAIAKRIIHTGERGTGAATKLAVNSLVHGLNVALSEALVLAEKAGVKREVAYEVFASGAAGAPYIGYKRQSFLHPESAPLAFTLDLVAKDLALITRLGVEVNAQVRQAETSLEIVRQAIEAGMGDRDLSAVAVFLRNRDE